MADRTARRIVSENDLARLVQSELEADGWTVYEEVQVHRGGAIADLVAERNGFLKVIETKMSLSLSVIEQAYQWQGYANAVFIAFPRFRPLNKPFYTDPKGQRIATLMCKHFGIGVLKIAETEHGFFENGIEFKTLSPAGFNRKPIRLLRDSLHTDLLAKGNAGVKGGGYWTPFRSTCDKLRTVVTADPGISMREAVASIDHHYQKDGTAVACLSKYLRDGVLEGIHTEYQGRTIRLYPKAMQVPTGDRE